ncbi:MAG: MFS transporter [Leptolyngbyaceae cyanobacterium]
MTGHAHSQLIMLLAQLSDPGIDTPEEAALIFSGPQFFIALLAGLVLAFGFQLLLTNLSVAAGISYVSRSSSDSSSGGPGAGKISAALGIWTLVTVSLALFFACWLAVKLSLYNSSLLGAITGLVIWGTYFTLLFWVSSTTVGSLIGSVVKTATASFNALVGTATSAFGAKAAGNQVIETAEAVASAVRKELSQTFDNEDLRDSLNEYVATLRSPQLETSDLEAEFERLIRESDIATSADYDTLRQLDRASFEKLVSSRTDLSRQEVKRVANQLYRTWQRNLNQAAGGNSLAELVDYVKSAGPDEKIADRLGDRLDQFLDEYRKRGQSQSSSALSQSLSQGFNALMGVVMGRIDLSDMDVEKIANQVNQAKSQLVDQGGKLARQLESNETHYSIVKADVETYLLNTYPWQLRSAEMKTQFRELLHDAKANPSILRQEIAALSRSDFESLLQSRGLLTPEEIDHTASQLEQIRTEVLREVTDIDRFEQAKALKSKVNTFLQITPKTELISDMGDRAFRALVEDADASYEDMQVRFSELGYDPFVLVLRARGDLNASEIHDVATHYDRLLKEALADAHNLQDAAKTRIDNQWQQLQDYLRNTDRTELNPEGIKADIKALMQEPDAGIRRLRQRLARFDRETLIQLLNQRHDLDEQAIRQVVSEVERNWYQAVNAPAALAAQAQAKYDEATRTLANYLRRTGKPELNPDGIKRDLQALVDTPKVGVQAMRERLSQMDRDTLVQLLSQRGDLSEEEVNQIIDDILQNIRDILKAPQRLARRAQQQVLSFEQSLEEYLRNTDKAALNPDGIKRDLQLLLNDPRLGGQRLQDRLAQIDRDTVVALLAQRQDMTHEEAAAAVDQVLAVRDQILSQLQKVQLRVQAMLNRLLARIRAYLNSLDRPELSYEGIRRDLRRLFDDPQSGFEALKYRFSQFDRNTLVAIVSSHDNVSEADANKVIDQIESVRDSALQKAERLEREVENRVQALKQQAHQQVEDTRKAAELAAWWIFGTATVSAVAAAIGGSLAVLG